MQRNGEKSLILAFVLVSSMVPFCVEQAFSDEKQQKQEDGYTVSEFMHEFRFEKDSSSQDAVFLRQKAGGAYLKLRQLDNVSFEHAKSYFSDKIFSIYSLYREAYSPYPGALSNKINCPKEFKPQRIRRGLLDYYLIYANQRFSYGVCLWDLIEYRAVLYPLYCSSNKRFYQIELFIPKHKDISIYQDALQKLSCE